MSTKIESQLKPPPKPEIKRRSKWFEILLLLLIFGFGTLAFFAKQYPYFPFDLYVTREIQLIKFPFFSELMIFMTTLGYTTQGSLLLIIGCLLLIVWQKKKDALILFASTTGAVILSIILKFIIARPRPDPELINQLAKYTVPDSFPSGHVLFFVGFVGYFLYLSYIYLQKSKIRIAAITICSILIILMGMSRIFLGAHWFSDTLGAYLIGTLWLFLIVSIRHKFVDFPSQKSK